MQLLKNYNKQQKLSGKFKIRMRNQKYNKQTLDLISNYCKRSQAINHKMDVFVLKNSN